MENANIGSVNSTIGEKSDSEKATMNGEIGQLTEEPTNADWEVRTKKEMG